MTSVVLTGTTRRAGDTTAPMCADTQDPRPRV